MAEEFDSNQPIYVQLLDRFRARIVSGDWPLGMRMDSVRNLALDFGVSPNTVQRALADLEREGLAYSERTAGRFITKDPSRLKGLQEELGMNETTAYLERMKALGLGRNDVLAMIEAHCQRKDTP